MLDGKESKPIYACLLDQVNQNDNSRGFSQAFYRERLYEKVMGFKDLEDFMVGYWEKWACSKGKSR